MDKRKIELLIQNIETAIKLLKIELEESEQSETSKNVFKLEDFIHGSIDNYEPEYYEEE